MKLTLTSMDMEHMYTTRNNIKNQLTVCRLQEQLQEQHMEQLRKLIFMQSKVRKLISPSLFTILQCLVRVGLGLQRESLLVLITLRTAKVLRGDQQLCTQISKYLYVVIRYFRASFGGGASQAMDDAITNSVNAGITYTSVSGNDNGNACK